MKKRWSKILLLPLYAIPLYAAERKTEQSRTDQQNELCRRLAQGASVSSFNKHWLGQSLEEDLKNQERYTGKNQYYVSIPARISAMYIQQHLRELQSLHDFKKQLHEWEHIASIDPKNPHPYHMNLDTRHIICMTYNLCDNPYAKVFTDPDVHERYWDAQRAAIISLIQDERPHILGLQGIRQDKEGHVALLREILSQSGYSLIVTANKETQAEEPLNIIAYRKEYVNKTINKCYWASSRIPGVSPDDWSDGGRLRPVLVATFEPTLILANTNYPCITVANVLSGPIRKDFPSAKIDFNDVHADNMNKILKKIPGIGLVMGDLTSLEDNDKITRELKVFSDNGFQNITATKTVSGQQLSKKMLCESYFSAQSKKIKQGVVGQIQCAMQAPGNVAAAYWSYASTAPCISSAQSLEIFGNIDRKKHPDLPCSNIPTIAYLIVTRNQEKPYEQHAERLKPIYPMD